MWRPTAILFCILLTAPTARPGQVVKNDDVTEVGQIVAFDGARLQLRKVYGSNDLVSIPLRDVARVQFREGREVEGDWSPAREKDLLPPIWKLKCANGDSVSGVLKAWTDSQMDLRLQVDEPVLKIPLPLVKEIWRSAPELVRKALDIKEVSATQDVVYVLRDGEVTTVKGAALYIQGDRLIFLYEGEQKKIPTDRILGVVLAPQKHSPTAGPAEPGKPRPHKLVLVNADVLTGRWTRLKDLKATFETSWGQAIDCRAETIWHIETSDNSTVFLSDLKPFRVEQTPYFDRVIPWRADAALDGGPLRLNDGHQYTHGISLHSRCVLEYDIEGKYTQFAARLGFEPLPPNLPPGRVAIRISADGSAKFESADFRSDQDPKDLTLDVRNAKRLLIEIDYGEGQDVNDRVVLANPRLLSTRGN